MNRIQPTANLTTRCVAGDEQAWRDLHRTFYPRVRAFLRRLGVPPREADDVCQDVFVEVFRYLDRFEGRAQFQTWLYKLCVTGASRYRRSRLPQFLRWLTEKPVLDALAVESHWNESEMADHVRRALDRMTHHHRVTFVLHELEGLSPAEIAQVLGCPISTIWRRLHYARREFEKWITDGPLGEA